MGSALSTDLNSLIMNDSTRLSSKEQNNPPQIDVRPGKEVVIDNDEGLMKSMADLEDIPQ